VTVLGDGLPRTVQFPAGARDFLCSKTFKPDIGPIHPRVECILGLFPPTVKQPGYEANHSYSLSAKAKNAWSYTGTPTYRFIL